MAIESSDFGPVRLSGEDAEQFKEQLREPPPAAAIRLVKLARQIKKNEDGSWSVPNPRP